MARHFLSLGAGVQSTTMALMALHGEIEPLPEVAIFADTQSEPRAVYAHLKWLRGVLEPTLPVEVVSAGSLKDTQLRATLETGTRFVSIPYFSKNPEAALNDIGIMRRQCTSEFKIKPLNREVRRRLGVGVGQRAPKGAATMWLGISTDEAVRAAPSRNKWAHNRFPLIEAGMSRQDCLRWMERHGYPRPPKSSCTFCPYHSDAVWREMKLTDPESWREAVDVDRALRGVRGRKNGTGKPIMRGEGFLHRSCVPLEEVDLRNAEDRGQLNLWLTDCQGICGV